MHIEYENATRLEPGEPKLAAIVSESAMMGLVAPVHRRAVDDFAVVRRTGLDVDRNKLVEAVAESFHAQRPDINKFLLPVDAGQIRGRAGFVSATRAGSEAESEHECGG